MLEVLVINDGSKDSSSAIAHQYQDKYPNVFRVIDKENGHYGSCVNRGLEESKGKYLRILDSDDYYDSKSLNLFVKQLMGVDVDSVYSPYSTILEATGQVINHKANGYMAGDIIDLQKTVLDDTFIHMHSLTYKVELLRSINYRQEEGICYTDTEYVFYPLCYAKTMLYTNHCVYKYCVGRDEQSTTGISFANNIEHLEKVLYNISSYLPSEQNINYKHIQRKYIIVLLRFMIDAHLFYKFNDDKEDKKLREIIKGYAKFPDVYYELFESKWKGFYYVRSFVRNNTKDRYKLMLMVFLRNISPIIKGQK